MNRRLLIIDGHPDPATGRFCSALADSYANGAREAGHTVETMRVAALAFPLLRTQQEFEAGEPVAAIAAAQHTFAVVDHVLIVYPLWLGTMPALLKAFLEQVFRPGFAFRYRDNGLPEKLLKGRSAHIVVTMGMPALAYRWFYRAHGLKSLERNILGFVGIAPIRETLIGGIGTIGAARRERWLARLARDGTKAR